MKKTADDIKVSELITLVLKGMALVMGVAVVVLSFWQVKRKSLKRLPNSTRVIERDK